MTLFVFYLVGVLAIFSGIVLSKLWDIYTDTLVLRRMGRKQTAFLFITSGIMAAGCGLAAMVGWGLLFPMHRDLLNAREATELEEQNSKRLYAGWENASSEIRRLQFRIDNGMAYPTTRLYNDLVTKYNRLMAAHNRLNEQHWQIRKAYLKPHLQYYPSKPFGRRFDNTNDPYYDDPFLPRNFSPDNVREDD